MQYVHKHWESKSTYQCGARFLEITQMELTIANLVPKIGITEVVAVSI